MKRKFQCTTRLARGLAAGLLLLPLGGCYVARQGAEQASLLLRQEPFERALADPGLSAEAKGKLRLLPAIKAFGAERLGLKRTRSYERLVRLDRDALSYVVVAAPELRLEPYAWWFPVLGSVPYKGYFDARDAEAEARGLREGGYDALVRKVPAFSTLGWLPDPVYSPMLDARTSDFVNTILHETAHATLYVNGQSDFNESFASYVGDHGAVAFCRAQFGAGAPETKQAEARLAANGAWEAWLGELGADLDALYRGAEPDAAKRRLKAERFERARRDALAQGWRVPEADFNNAWVAANRTYQSGRPVFEALGRRAHGDVARIVKALAEAVPGAKDPLAVARALFPEAPTPRPSAPAPPPPGR